MRRARHDGRRTGDLLSLTPPPTLSPTADHLYRQAAGRAYHEGKRSLNPRGLEWVLRLRAEKFQRWVAETDVVFELGTGAGWNLGQLRCARRIGSDPAEFLAERVRSLGIEFVSDSTALPDETAQVALCHHVLEHVVNPAAALNELRRILRPGGRLIVHVPWEVERSYSRFRRDEPNYHLFTWNPQNLGNFLSVLGWNVQEARVRSYGYDRFAANAAVRWHLGERGFRLLRRFLMILRPLREAEVVAQR